MALDRLYRLVAAAVGAKEVKSSRAADQASDRMTQGQELMALMQDLPQRPAPKIMSADEYLRRKAEGTLDS